MSNSLAIDSSISNSDNSTLFSLSNLRVIFTAGKFPASYYRLKIFLHGSALRTGRKPLEELLPPPNLNLEADRVKNFELL